jgi:hypothetical protein
MESNRLFELNDSQKKQAIEYAKSEIGNSVHRLICPCLMEYVESTCNILIGNYGIKHNFPTLHKKNPWPKHSLSLPYYPKNKEGQQKRLELLEQMEQNDLNL